MGSSHTMKRGSTASATRSHALALPPENSCGYRRAAWRAEPALHELGHRVALPGPCARSNVERLADDVLHGASAG